MNYQITLKALQAAHKKALAKLERAKTVEDNAMQWPSRLCKLRQEAAKLLEDDPAFTGKNLPKFEKMADRERELLTHSKIDLLKAMDNAFNAEQEANDIMREIQYCQMRINMRAAK